MRWAWGNGISDKLSLVLHVNGLMMPEDSGPGHVPSPGQAGNAQGALQL